MAQSTGRYSRTYFELIEAFGQPDCGVCRVVDNAVLGYIDMFLYENVNNLARRAEIRAARGFCTTHAGLVMTGYGRKQSISLLQQDIVNDVIEQWDAQPRVSWIDRLLGRLPTGHGPKGATFPQRNCPLCDYEHIQEIGALRTLADDVLDPDMLKAFEQSAALCLPHFHMFMGLDRIRSKHVAKVIEVERRVLSTVKAQLDEYVHKQNPEYKDEEKGDEADAPVTATRMTSGRIHHTDARRHSGRAS